MLFWGIIQSNKSNASLLSGAMASQFNTDPTMAMVTKFLDSGGDGSALDDVANPGMKFLAGLFGRKK